MWSIRDWDKWSDELKEVVRTITNGEFSDIGSKAHITAGTITKEQIWGGTKDEIKH